MLAFSYCDTPLKMALLLHKTALVNFSMATTVEWLFLFEKLLKVSQH